MEENIYRTKTKNYYVFLTPKYKSILKQYQHEANHIHLYFFKLHGKKGNKAEAREVKIKGTKHTHM